MKKLSFSVITKKISRNSLDPQLRPFVPACSCKFSLPTFTFIAPCKQFFVTHRRPEESFPPGKAFQISKSNVPRQS